MFLPFKSADDFLQYCHSQFPSKPVQGQGRPALIPPEGYLGGKTQVSQTDDGRLRASLIVCGEPDGFFVVSETAKQGLEELKPNDLVIWMPFKKPSLWSKQLSVATGDRRSDWVGFIVAKIAPEIGADGKFTVLCSYQ